MSFVSPYPNSAKSLATGDIAYAFAGSLFIALCAQISLCFPFTPVPFAFQAQAVLATAILLGPERGFLAICAYLLEGICGLPVFAQGGFGLATLCGVSGGYLMSYLLAGRIVTRLAARRPHLSFLTCCTIMAVGNAIVLLVGAVWLSFYVGVTAAWSLGVVPFLLSDCLKIAMFASALPFLKRGLT